MLRAELRRIEPEAEAEVHRRASAWHAGRGDVDARDPPRHRGRRRRRAPATCSGASRRLRHDGRDAAVRGWLHRFSREQIAAHRALALAAATSALARGDRDLRRALARGRRPARRREPPADGRRRRRRVLRALVARDGVARMRDDAARARARLPDDSPWLALCGLLAGRGAAPDRRPRRAPRGQLEEGARRGAVARPASRCCAWPSSALLALEEDDVETARAVHLARAARRSSAPASPTTRLAALVFAARRSPGPAAGASTRRSATCARHRLLRRSRTSRPGTRPRRACCSPAPRCA